MPPTHSCSKRQLSRASGLCPVLLCSGIVIRLRSRVRFVLRFAVASLACRASDGRRWYRSSKPAKKIGASSSSRWRQLMTHFRAPTVDDATEAAEEEITFSESLCDQPLDTLIAVHRSFEKGAVRESFRALRPRNGPKPLRAFSFLEVDGEDEQPGEAIDLISMAG